MLFDETVGIERVVIERLLCDKCGTQMKSEPITLTTFPPQFPYKCPKCGYTTTAPGVYPHYKLMLNNGEEFPLYG